MPLIQLLKNPNQPASIARNKDTTEVNVVN